MVVFTVADEGRVLGRRCGNGFLRFLSSVVPRDVLVRLADFLLQGFVDR